MPAGAVLVTGGTGGLGRQVCLQLGSLGWQVIVGYRHDSSGAQQIVKEISGHRGVASALQLDLNNVEHLNDGLTELSTEGLSSVIFCAGSAPHISPLMKFTRKDFLEPFDSMVVGHFELLKYLWKTHFQPQKFGHVVAVSSVATEIPPPPQMAGYVLAKSALESLIRCSCVELGSRGLRATIVRPSYTNTAMLHTAFDSRFIEQLGLRGQVLAPRAVASLITKTVLEPPHAGHVAVESIYPGDNVCN